MFLDKVIRRVENEITATENWDTCAWVSPVDQRGQNPTTFFVTVIKYTVVAFSLHARILGECSTIHSPPVLFFFFSKWRLARVNYFHSVGQDQSTVAQRVETTVTERYLTSCM